MKKKVCENLAVKKKSTELNPEFVNIARQGVLKFGKISIHYLIRKLKVTESMAKQICDIFNAPT
jgi:hypothetical protein